MFAVDDSTVITTIAVDDLMCNQTGERNRWVSSKRYALGHCVGLMLIQRLQRWPRINRLVSTLCVCWIYGSLRYNGVFLSDRRMSFSQSFSSTG